MGTRDVTRPLVAVGAVVGTVRAGIWAARLIAGRRSAIRAPDVSEPKLVLTSAVPPPQQAANAPRRPTDAWTTDETGRAGSGSTVRSGGPPFGPSGISWGWLAFLSFVASIGLLCMVAAYALSRAGRTPAEPLFWAGFLLIVVPISARLFSHGPGRGERVMLIAAIGVFLYLSKVLHDPFAFTYSDELIHLSNAEAIQDTGRLFPQNPVLPVTTYYPGLGAATAALSELTGLSPFAAGLVIIGAARLLIMLTLFLLFERLTGSPRLASVAALVYIASPNFLFWSVQYSYQSLALPLAVLAVLAVLMRGREREPSPRLAWTLVAMLAIAATVTTHHLTSYALGILLVVVSAVALLRRRPQDAAWGLALFTAAAILVWGVQVAPFTQDYLSSIFSRTFEGVSSTIGGTSAPRRLFQASSGQEALLWERAVGLASVAIIALLLPFGLWRIWKRRRRDTTLLVVLGVGAAAYLAILPLRLVASAWEVANRASDFLYLGIAVTVALAGLHLWRPRRLPWPRTAIACAVVAVITVGGAVAGWPPRVRLSQPYEAVIGGRTVLPQGVALAKWSLADLGPGQRFVADEANGRLLLSIGRQLPRVGRDGLARTILEADRLTPEMAQFIRDSGTSYVTVDRRRISADNMAGYFFAPRGQPLEGTGGVFPRERVEYLDRAHVSRLFDSGDIVVYDVRGVRP